MPRRPLPPVAPAAAMTRRRRTVAVMALVVLPAGARRALSRGRFAHAARPAVGVARAGGPADDRADGGAGRSASCEESERRPRLGSGRADLSAAGPLRRRGQGAAQGARAQRRDRRAPRRSWRGADRGGERHRDGGGAGGVQGRGRARCRARQGALLPRPRRRAGRRATERRDRDLARVAGRGAAGRAVGGVRPRRTDARRWPARSPPGAPE